MVKKLLLLLALLSYSLFGMAESYQEDQLVLVASKHSDITPLSQSEIRRLFLGKTITSNGFQLKPILNNTDEKVHDVFLQNIVFMTENSYRRHLLKRTVKYGDIQPLAASNIEAIVEEFNEDEDHYCISYMWLSDLNENMKVIQTIWTGIR